MRKYIKFLILILLLYFQAIVVFAYKIPEDEVRKIETFDDEICQSRGHSYKSEFTVRLYWECRINLIKERIANFKATTRKQNKFYITELKRIIRIIENISEKLESDFQTKMNLYTPVNRKIVLKGEEQYYYNLFVFLQFDYSLKDINSSREIKNIIKQRELKEKNEKKISVNEQLKKYPACIRYDLGSKDFINCINKNTQIEQCRETVIKKLALKANEIRFLCKNKAYENYPDYMALYNSEFEELKNIKEDKFVSDKEKIDKVKNRMAELNKLMTGPRLSKTQLISLREYSEKKCLIDNEIEANFYRLSLNDECEKLLKE